MKNKVTVRIDYHGAEGTRVQKTTGIGAMVLTTQENGDTTINAMGKFSEPLMAATGLQMCGAAYAKLEDPYMRMLLANAVGEIATSAAAMREEMVKELESSEPAQPDPNDPLA